MSHETCAGAPSRLPTAQGQAARRRPCLKAGPQQEVKAKQRAKTFEDIFVSKPEHNHCKQVLASKRIRDACFTGWDTSREPYFPEDKGCYYLAANLEICPTTGREHWQGIACFNTVQPAQER